MGTHCLSQAKSVEVGREKGSHSGIPLPARHSNFCSVDLSVCHYEWDLCSLLWTKEVMMLLASGPFQGRK